ncbi:MAG TPA: carboxypeptidase-like regulatory domain-containing protein [Bryobacteraceae bacterium]|nr:carboxypeptidase-like regulatory domain-containing protein [Bryobacteraceae bacterium]
MRTRGRFLRLLILPALLVWAGSAWADAPMTKIDIQVKTEGGHPVDRAAVIVRFVEGRSYIKLGKKIRTTYELRTNQEGQASIPSIPQGKILIQIIAKGYQTFGQTFDINEAEKTVNITLKPPQPQYSTYK